MNSLDVIKVAEACKNAQIFIFSPTHGMSKCEFQRIATLCVGATRNKHAQMMIEFESGSIIRFVTGIEYERIAGSEITLAVMNGVSPTVGLESRSRIGHHCEAPEHFELPKIVRYSELD